MDANDFTSQCKIKKGGKNKQDGLLLYFIHFYPILNQFEI